MRLFSKPKIKFDGRNNTFDFPKSKNNKRFKHGTIKIKGDDNLVRVENPGDLENTKIRIYGHHNTVILQPGCSGKFFIQINSSNCTVIIGKNTGTMGTDIELWDEGSKVIIGEDCIIAKNTHIYCTDFHAIYKLADNILYNQGKEIIIGNHVWLCEGVTVTKNTHIADNITVGINSTVTKDLTTSYAVYAGNPATLKKTDINWLHDTYDMAVQNLNIKEK